MKLSWKKVRLKLKSPFKISHGTFNHRDSLIVSLTHLAKCGRGELTEITYYNWSIDECIEALENTKSKIENLHPEENHYELLLELIPDLAPLRSALDCALWDLKAKLNNTTIHEMLNLGMKDVPESSLTFTADNYESLSDRINESSWPIAKIKLGTENDHKVLESLAQNQLEKVIRIDANEGWSVSFMQEHVHILQKLPIDIIEQPLPATDNQSMQQLPEFENVLYVADESCQDILDIEECAKYFDGVNIKLMKAGGITPALKMIEKARKQELKLMAGCMTETHIGIRPMAEIASLFDYIDLDGSYLLHESSQSKNIVIDGKIRL